MRLSGTGIGSGHREGEGGTESNCSGLQIAQSARMVSHRSLGTLVVTAKQPCMPNMAVVLTRREPPSLFKGRAAARRTPLR